MKLKQNDKHEVKKAEKTTKGPDLAIGLYDKLTEECPHHYDFKEFNHWRSQKVRIQNEKTESGH